MLDGLFKVLSEQDFLSSDWLIFYAGLAAVALPWLLNKLYQKITYKPRMFEGDIYDLQFPVSDNGAIVGRETELDSLTQAWRSPEIRVLALVVWAGVGKTALVNVWREAIKFSEDETLSPQRIYAWSFQNQGIANAQTSSGAFFDHALRWFKSDCEKFGSEHDKSEHYKGVYLAKLINTQRTLLILDGLEVFQPYSTAELQGQLNDPAILGLLQTLAKDNAGLCLLTTRQALGEHLTRHQGVRHQSLENLSTAAIQLLQGANVKGKSEELERVAIEYHGHAYSLTLLASYLRQYAKGDISRRDTLPALTDETRAEGWQAQQLFWAYADALEDSAELGLLYLISVFDQAVERELILELIRALKQGGYQTALNKLKLAQLHEPQRWAACCRRLRQQGLLLGHSDETLDLHPLARDFFRREFERQHRGIKKLIHLELYAYYKALPEKEFPDTLEEMQPLFSAVAHGCAAGLHQQALDEVYWPRIQRKEYFLYKKLGAFSDDLTTVAHFFTTPWHTLTSSLTEAWQAWILSVTVFDLRALGRLREALESMQIGIEMHVKQEKWKNAAINVSNFSELQLTLGDVSEAVESGARSSSYADQSGDMFERMSDLTTHADALHQAGNTAAALALFREAEQLQQERQPVYPRLYSLSGFQYCDLLLAQGSTAEVLERAEYALEISTEQLGLLSVALDQLTLGRAHLQQAVEATPPQPPLVSGGARAAFPERSRRVARAGCRWFACSKTTG